MIVNKACNDDVVMVHLGVSNGGIGVPPGTALQGCCCFVGAEVWQEKLMVVLSVNGTIIELLLLLLQCPLS